MRRAPALVVFALALAGPAGAQQGRMTVVAPAAAPTLRGAIAAGAPAPGEALAPAFQVLFPPMRSASSPVEGQAGQCRLSCAQSYYFCLSADGGDDCAPTWSQCRAACDAPGVAGLAGG